MAEEPADSGVEGGVDEWAAGDADDTGFVMTTINPGGFTGRFKYN